MITRQIFFQRALDVAMFVATLAAVGTSFVDDLPEWVTLVVLTAFVIMFFWRWYIAEDRSKWMKSNWFDLVVVVLLASPILRMLMALRFAQLLPALRIGVLLRANKARLMRLLVLSGESLPVAMAMVFGIVFIFGTTTYLLEHPYNPQFSEMQDGLWWAFVTLTTVGYGDIYPVTASGRVVAVMTMIFGVVVYSLIIANVTVFLDQYTHKENEKKRLAEQAVADKEHLRLFASEVDQAIEAAEKPSSEKTEKT
ncbi:MAG: potassium channel family protein [Mariprofundus sp.]|nr:potassium channel family protein [Mariprofundus sp.]